MALSKKFEKQSIPHELIDGDSVRDILKNTGFDKKSRDEHVKRIGYTSHLLEKHGVTVIACFVSPYQESREFARKQCKNFFEIYLSTPLRVCEDRDPKGLYKKARAGHIKEFTGLDAPYEVPKNADLTLDTSKMSIDEAVELIFLKLREHNEALKNT